ncbi:ATP-binding protein [Roseomonas sp. USHLN139]|uniref:ATP-binding protein n=1 Tax=Roseomonas sp. USHLN139 TaxID=3081298 RepID=UPI003B012DFE
MGLIRRVFPATLLGQTLATLLIGFVLLLGAVVGLHDYLQRAIVDRSIEEILAQRMATLLETLDAVPAAQRDTVAAALAQPDLAVRRITGWLPEPEEAGEPAFRRISERALSLAKPVRALRIQSGTFDPSMGHLIGIVGLAWLADGTWLEIRLSSTDIISTEMRLLYAYLGLFGISLLAAMAFASRLIAGPLATLAAAVARLDLARPPAPVASSGPREVRQLAEAINTMAARTYDAFRQRTLALGALSHDLMSPIARLRLRAEDLPPGATDPIRQDLAEMEAMVADVLAYLRSGEPSSEPLRPVSVSALARTVVDEFLEAGQVVMEHSLDERAIVPGRRVPLKRALTNLVANALRYGRDPWVEVTVSGTEVLLLVGDRGPGIATDDLPHVTKPFFRGDAARSRGGGSGLGLATVVAIAEAHGGQLELASVQGRGTLATLRLPLQAAADRRE